MRSWSHPVWALGFRPFFLLAALAASVWMPLWSLIYGAVFPLPMNYMAPVWHGHEMIFGFTAAVIAGFLLTAVPNWTGVPGHRGGALAALAAIWLAGRAAMLLSAWLPLWLVAIVDAAFFPALAAAIRPSIVAAGKPRHFLFPRVLMAFAAADALIHLGAMRIVPNGEELGLKTAIDLVTVLMVVVGGRVVPSFTANAVGSPPREPNWTDRWALYAVLALTGLEFIPALPWLQGLAALTAGAINAWRMRGWQTVKTAGRPILWVLHLGYAWVVIGLLLRAASLTGWMRWQDAIHGLGAGAIGTFTLGMMSRVALGHTGRPRKVAPVIAAAYLMISFAAMLRIITPLAVPAVNIVVATHVASCLWAGAFLIYLIVYAPKLLRPRADGRPG